VCTQRSNPAMGVDVSEMHGLDIVVMDDSLAPHVFRTQTLTELAHALERWVPDIIAIDSPPGWGASGNSRLAERQLGALGISSYSTPSDPASFGRPFYGWMKKMGFAAFAVAAAAGYERYREGDVLKSAIEVFPYGTAVALAGYLPPGKPSNRAKMRWRTEILVRAGVDVRPLHTIDLVDAGLAALTGVLALGGQRVGVGDPPEGVIVLPLRVLPTARWKREVVPAA
jgi:predicted RNase H-like nuclease